jgi:excinuclease ABC subunit C
MPSWCGEAKDFLIGQIDRCRRNSASRWPRPRPNDLDFETAAMLRDRLRRRDLYSGQPGDQRRGVGDADIFALAASKGGQMSIQAFFIRGGQNWGHRALLPRHTAEVAEDEVLSRACLLQFYEEVPPPRTILVDREPRRAQAPDPKRLVRTRRAPRSRFRHPAARHAAQAR